ncbi:MAG: SDR family NAD(P)-dependent oxidoreductase [Actinomycetota bacterium]
MAKTAVVTGASSGIGAATARALVKEGFDVLIGARRVERLQALADETGARWKQLDVTDGSSVDAFCAGIETLDLLVNNAGGAKGLDIVAESTDESWEWMFQTNVLGLVRMTRALVPALERSGDGMIINIGSTASHEPYAGGAGYVAAKHSVRVISQSMRMEMLGRPIRICEIDPGLVGGAEFSLVRFDGDVERAAKVYEGLTPLTPEDIADCIVFTATRPSHVNIEHLIVRPREQAWQGKVHRST